MKEAVVNLTCVILTETPSQREEVKWSICELTPNHRPNRFKVPHCTPRQLPSSGEQGTYRTDQRFMVSPSPHLLSVGGCTPLMRA